MLVTGGSGFVALHCIAQLLQKGYAVRATVRSLKKNGYDIEALKQGNVFDYTKLEFIETDLINDANWDNAMKDCTYVLHVASPIGLNVPRTEEEIIRPAVDGTLRVSIFPKLSPTF